MLPGVRVNPRFIRGPDYFFFPINFVFKPLSLARCPSKLNDLDSGLFCCFFLFLPTPHFFCFFVRVGVILFDRSALYALFGASPPRLRPYKIAFSAVIFVDLSVARRVTCFLLSLLKGLS